MTTPPFDISAIEKMTPEQYSEFIIRLAAVTTADEAAENLKISLRTRAAAGDGYENYMAFHELIHGAVLDEHLQKPVKMGFDAHDRGEFFLWMGFRGCRKTTTEMTIDAFLLGHHPEGTGIVTGASDDNAVINAKFIAQIIELHPEFKRVFPYVKPKDKAWGADGYWLVDTRMSEEAWKQKQASVIDPSFVGGGYKSARINGKHPSLFLSADDLHDIDSSQSVAEREYIKQVFFSQILKTIIRKDDKILTRVDITGVPFSKDDTYAILRQSGGTAVYILPVMVRAPEGKGTYIDGVNAKTGVTYEDIVGWWYLTWPENFGAKSIINARSEGKSAFWQMFMLDIETAKTAGLRYYLYDHKEIGFNLPMVGGADPTGVDPDREVGGKKRSSFALCYLGKLPMGGAVVVDGYLKPCGIIEAKDAMLQAQTMFPNWRTTGVENVGVGKVFLQYLRTDARVRVQDSNLRGPGGGGIKSKEDRFLTETHPWLENAVIRISDAPTPYNMALRRLCDNFFDLDKHDEAWDAGDALYHAAKLIPEVLRQPVHENISPVAMQARGGLWHPLAGGRTNGIR